MTAAEIIEKYISFFEKRGHKRIDNTPLIPKDDPSTLFTSAGMQPLIPYLLGKQHSLGTRLVNVQNCFRAVDIDEIGDNRHTTFFRMLGNWSLGDYFNKEEIPWLWEFLTVDLGLPKEKLYVTVFKGYKDIPKDEEADKIWTKLLEKEGLDPKERIIYYDDNWWSRSGGPDNMPAGEPGGPSTEVFYRFDVQHDEKIGKECHLGCECGKFLEIANSVFMQYIKQKDGTFKDLPKRNVDFGGGLERILYAVNDDPDIFKTTLHFPIIEAVEQATGKNYQDNTREMRIVADHFISASFIILEGVKPSNKEQGYILRRLIRRALDGFYSLSGTNTEPILRVIVEQYRETDPKLEEQFEEVKLTILTEEKGYKQTMSNARSFIKKRYRQIGDDLMGSVEISAEDAFTVYTTHGLSPTQIKSLGYTFDEQAFGELLKEHQTTSKKGASQKFERRSQKA